MKKLKSFNPSGKKNGCKLLVEKTSKDQNLWIVGISEFFLLDLLKGKYDKQQQERILWPIGVEKNKSCG